MLCFLLSPLFYFNVNHKCLLKCCFLMQGAFTHQDFSGHKGTIRAGDVQVRLTPTQSSSHKLMIHWILSPTNIAIWIFSG
jgi:hypothetical protein